ncbi:MAG: carboxypeptidase regulatory-like domain-containing protein [Acidobacteriia bacterium]|nr:carboxypeptidase regulatory-like domain-containing protein [Terriglobia bacterium]
MLGLLILLIGSDFAWGQTTGTIRGTVTDPSGAVVPGASVTVVLNGTAATRKTASDRDGDYVFPALAVGQYAVTVHAQGFSDFQETDVQVSIGRVAVVNAQLQLASLSQAVTAEATPPLIETTSTQLGAVVDGHTVSQLPLNARDTYQLLQLQPGVQSEMGSELFYGSDRVGVVSVNGGRGRSNNYTVNGGDANDQFANLPAIQPSPDAIEEFRVLTNTFDAEFGRNSGAIVNVVTKSGTNSFHGNVFEFFRNQQLNARNFFELTRPDFKQNQFGGTLGGPIKKDRAFFFLSYEGRRIHQGIPSSTVAVPTAAERVGDYSLGSPFAGTLTDDNVASVLNNRPGCATAAAAQGGAPVAAGTAYADIFPGNVIPSDCFDPTARDLMNQFVPLPNLGADLYQASPLQRNRVDQGTIRVDHRLNDSQQLNVYYYLTDDYLAKPFARFQAGGAELPGFGDLTNDRFQQASVTHTWAANASTVNEFRFSFFREGQGRFLHPQRTNLVQDSCKTVPPEECFSDLANPLLGITPHLGATHEGVPFVALSGGFSFGNNLEGELPQFGNTFQLSDSLSKVVGKHTLKFGADVRRQQFDQTLYFSINGQYNFFGGGPNDMGFDNLIPNYLLGLSDYYLQGSAQREWVRNSSLYLYGQDSWKVRPNVTLNYGLRWELNTPIADIGQRVQTFRPGQDTKIFPCQLGSDNPLAGVFGTTDCGPGSAGEAVFPRGLVIPGDAGVPTGLTQTYYHAFAPRIGLAWSPDWKGRWLRSLTGGPGKTSVRMGWGMFYNPIEQLVLEQFSAAPPFGGSSALSNTFFNLPFEGQDGTVNPNPFNGILDPQRGKPVDFSVFRPILLFGQFQPRLRAQYSVQYDFTIQRQVTDNLFIQVGFVGSQGHRLLATHDLNYGNPQTCLDIIAIQGPDACGPFFADSSFFIPANSIPAGVTLHLPYGSVPSVTGPDNPDITLVGLRQYSSPFCEPTTGAGCPPDGVPVFSSIFAQDTIANSNYNSLQVSMEKRFSHGLQFQLSYTWGKSFDQASSFENILNPLDYRRSYSLSLFDARNRLVYSYYWELPFRARRGIAGKLTNGWALSGIASFQSGFPIRITSSDDLELMNSFDFELPGEPDLVRRFFRLNPRGFGNLGFDPSSFVPQALGTIGSSPRSVCCGPGINNFDVGLQKRTALSERTSLEFRAEFFNIVNHAQFLAPDGNISDGADFGRVKRARDPRLIQFGLRFAF